MKKLRKRLAHVLSNLTATDAQLAVARARVEHLRKAEQRNERRARAANHAADLDRAHGHKDSAAKHDREHARFDAKAHKLNGTKRVEIGKIKRLIQKRDGLAHTREELEAELKKRESGGVTIKGNKVTGGTPDARIRACITASAAACASGHRVNRYSQTGYKDLEHCIEGIKYGARDDCSSWGTSVSKSCGLPDPNGQNYEGEDWTGSAERYLRSIGHEVSAAYAMQHPCIVLYGPVGATHHWEWSKADGTTHTDGHGSDPVDEGDFYMLGGEVHFYKPPTK